jgi:hypothetical protein
VLGNTRSTPRDWGITRDLGDLRPVIPFYRYQCGSSSLVADFGMSSPVDRSEPSRYVVRQHGGTGLIRAKLADLSVPWRSPIRRGVSVWPDLR